MADNSTPCSGVIPGNPPLTNANLRLANSRFTRSFIFPIMQNIYGCGPLTSLTIGGWFATGSSMVVLLVRVHHHERDKIKQPPPGPHEIHCNWGFYKQKQGIEIQCLVEILGIIVGIVPGDYLNHTMAKSLVLERLVAGSLYLFCRVSFGGSTPMAWKNSIIQVLNDWNLTLLVIISWFHLMA